jgi:hypothetical protein
MTVNRTTDAMLLRHHERIVSNAKFEWVDAADAFFLRF